MMVRRLPKLLNRAKDKINWGNPPMLQKQVVDPSPCLECAYCVPRGEHDFSILNDICICPERVKQMADEWTIATREGRRCGDFTDKIQKKLSEFE